MGPNDPVRPLQETNDISYTWNSREWTSGTLTWSADQAGEQEIVLNVKPYQGVEIEKVFVVMLYGIQGRPSSVGNGEVSPTAGNVTLKVSLTMFLSLRIFVLL